MHTQVPQKTEYCHWTVYAHVSTMTQHHPHSLDCKCMLIYFFEFQVDTRLRCHDPRVRRITPSENRPGAMMAAHIVHSISGYLHLDAEELGHYALSYGICFLIP